jgi:hypothetical protein
MNELPAIAIEPTAENDLIVVLNALFSTRDAALLVTRPSALLETYRAELGLLRDILSFEPDSGREVPLLVHDDGPPALDGSILR